MRICAAYGRIPEILADADMQEFRLDVFGNELPSDLDRNSVITLCGKDASAVPDGFKGLVDVGDKDAQIPFRKIRSVHDFNGTPSVTVLKEMLKGSDCEISKVACKVRSFSDLRTIYDAASSSEKEHVILGMGDLGTVTRIRQKILRNSFTFGFSGERTADGQLSVDEMERLGDGCYVIGITGHPLAHSLSPVMQNAAMNASGINGICLKFDSPDISGIEDTIRDYDIRGMNVTIPYKRDVVGHLDRIEDAAGSIGSVNTIVNKNGTLVGTNTDHAGITYAFEKAGRPLREHNSVLVFGSGGAARAAAYAAVTAGCDTRVLGRNEKTVAGICRDIGCDTAPKASIKGYDAVINCTPIGMYEDSEYLFDISEIDKCQTIMDMVYNRKTELVTEAELKGCTVASGKDMLVGQGALAFEKWFGIHPDTNVMERAIE